MIDRTTYGLLVWFLLTLAFVWFVATTAEGQTDTPTVTPTATATSTVTPTSTVAPCATFHLSLSDPNTNPPSQNWGKDLVRRLKLAQFASSCEGGGGGGGATPAPGSVGFETTTATCPDSGDGDPSTLVLDPACAHLCNIALTVADADGCDITVSEASAAEGDYAVIVNTSANYARFYTQAGVFVAPHGARYLNEDYALTLKYDGGQWVDVSNNDPNTTQLSLSFLQDFADAGPFPAANECQVLCADTSILGGASSRFAGLTGDGEFVDFSSCTCPGVGSGSVLVGPAGAASAQVCIAIGDGAQCTGIGAVSIGAQSAGSPADCAGENAVCIGRHDEPLGQGPISGDRAVQIGTFPIEQFGEDSICIGSFTTCNYENALCLGEQCIGRFRDAIFGSADMPLHEVWAGFEPTFDTCGNMPAFDDGSNDVAGRFTADDAVALTSCSFTFHRAWQIAPSCYANDETQLVLLQVVATTTTLTINTAGDLDEDVISYGCKSHDGATPTPTP